MAKTSDKGGETHTLAGWTITAAVIRKMDGHFKHSPSLVRREALWLTNHGLAISRNLRTRAADAMEKLSVGSERIMVCTDIDLIAEEGQGFRVPPSLSDQKMADFATIPVDQQRHRQIDYAQLLQGHGRGIDVEAKLLDADLRMEAPGLEPWQT